MVIKAFDTLEALSKRFGSEVFEDITDKTLYVYHRTENAWVRYRWTPGRREIRYVEEVKGELPIIIQVYPEIT